MKNIIIINGSIRPGGQTDRVIKLFQQKLNSDYSSEVLNLRDLNLTFCKGCIVCLSRGEEFCPGKDDRDVIIQKLDAADVIIFVSPNYSLGITHLMKNFFDRLAFIYHRPRFFGKVFTCIITQGVYGGTEIEKYFKTTAGFWGGNYVKGEIFTLPTGAYVPAKGWKKDEEDKVNRGLMELKKRVDSALKRDLFPRPSLFRLLIYRMSRSSHKHNQEDNRDFRYFKEKGWFEKPYYYEVKLGIVKSLIGWVADLFAKRMVDKDKLNK